MKTNFLENNHMVHVAPTASVAAGEDFYDGAAGACVKTDVVSLANADGAVFILTTMANASGGNSSVYMCACDDTSPTTTVAVSFRYMQVAAPNTIIATGESKDYLTSTAADVVYVFEVDAAKVAEQGYEFLQLVIDEVTNQAVDGALCGFLTGLRYKEDDAGTQVA